MQSYYHSIYLSPHLDDAALSCGGQIYAETTSGNNVLIVTLMAGDPPKISLSDFALSLHRQWQLESDTVARRLQEDIEACRVLGADYVHWHVPDCIYRTHPQTGEAIYASSTAIFGGLHETESALIDELALYIDGLPRCGRLLVPLTVGHHVDHQLTRRAAEAMPRGHLSYYEDFPYVAEVGALETIVSASDPGWQPHLIRLTEPQLNARVEAVAAYDSQIAALFADRHEMEKRIRNHVAHTGGERLWFRSSSPTHTDST